MKRYVLIAGVNGAGKSTLFSLIPSLAEVEKINLDDTVREIGSWQDPKVVAQAAKKVLYRIREYFEGGISFSQETTLCGKTIFTNIQNAKSLGYTIEMHYVGLDSPGLAKERVKNRVERGGHGISDLDIERRYIETLDNVSKVLPYCDLAVFYDNTDVFKRVAIYKNGRCVWQANNLPEWYIRIL